MTAVFFVMRFDIAPIVIWIFELPLDQEIRAVTVIRILLRFERGLVVVAIAEDRSGYVVGMKVHDSPQLTNSKKAYCDPGRIETASPRFPHGTRCGGTDVAFLDAEVGRERRRKAFSPSYPKLPSRQ